MRLTTDGGSSSVLEIATVSACTLASASEIDSTDPDDGDVGSAHGPARRGEGHARADHQVARARGAAQRIADLGDRALGADQHDAGAELAARALHDEPLAPEPALEQDTGSRGGGDQKVAAGDVDTEQECQNRDDAEQATLTEMIRMYPSSPFPSRHRCGSRSGCDHIQATTSSAEKNQYDTTLSREILADRHLCVAQPEPRDLRAEGHDDQAEIAEPQATRYERSRAVLVLRPRTGSASMSSAPGTRAPARRVRSSRRLPHRADEHSVATTPLSRTITLG